MNATAKKCMNLLKPSVIREYDIGDTKYVVTATVKTGASEDAMAKVRRLIRKEIIQKDYQKRVIKKSVKKVEN